MAFRNLTIVGARLVLLAVFLVGTYGVDSKLVRAQEQSDPECRPGQSWMWVSGYDESDVAVRVQQELAVQGIDVRVEASGYGEMDNCGTYEQRGIDFAIHLLEAAQPGLVEDLIPVLQKYAKSLLGNVKLFSRDGQNISTELGSELSALDSMQAQSFDVGALSGDPITRKVYVIAYDPLLSNGKSLTEDRGWNNHATLTQQTVDFFKQATNNKMNYEVVETTVVTSGWPRLADGFTYTEAEYMAVLANPGSHHTPTGVDYNYIVNSPEFDICGKANRGEIDEVWIYNGPWFGFWESTLVGPGAYFYNSGPVDGAHNCNRLIPIMGPSPERGPSEAVHNFGHRSESTMEKVYGSWHQNSTSHNWNRFGLVKAQSPSYSYSGCGSIHLPPNASSEYAYSSSASVLSNCDDFLNYPNLSDPLQVAQPVTCSTWGCTQLGFLGYWFGHMPSFPGCGPDNVANDWWKYLASPANALYPSSACQVGMHWISGNVGAGNVTLRYTDGTLKTVQTDAYGNYSLLVSNHWSGTITPLQASYSFTPANISYFDVQSEIYQQNYTADPATYYVDIVNGNDTNVCTSSAAPCRNIQETINKAGSGNLIKVASGTYTFSSNPSPNVVIINKDITLSGGWTSDFSSQSSASTINGGNVNNGILLISGNVIVENFIVENSRSSNSGAIYIVNGNFTLKRSTLRNNTATGNGAGIFLDNGALTVVNSTISGNIAGGSGGGIYASLNSGASVTIQNSTIAYNQANQGGGISRTNGTYNITNTIIANNTATSSRLDCSGTIAQANYSLIENMTGCTITSGSSNLNMDPQLDASLTGPWLAHVPFMGSPVIDAGTASGCPAKDQEGTTRPQGSGCDIGSVEYTGWYPTLTPTHTMTHTATITATVTPTRTPTRTPTLTHTPTITQSGTITPTPTAISTNTAVCTSTSIATFTPTFTPSSGYPTDQPTLIPTLEFTPTPISEGDTVRASVNSNNAQGNGYSSESSISDDGRYIAFKSDATNLVSGDTNRATDIFVYDMQTGLTRRVSVNSMGMESNDYSFDPSISANGRYVVFVSSATNLVQNRRSNIFIYDLQTGVIDCLSISPDDVYPNGMSRVPSISGDGRFVAFESYATNLVDGDTNAKVDVFWHDRQTGVTKRVSVDSNDLQANGHSFSPSISVDGRYIAYESEATNLAVNDTNGKFDVFMHDVIRGTTTLISTDSNEIQANGNSQNASISEGGLYVTFESDATNLVPDDTNAQTDVFVHNVQVGTITRASVDSDFLQGNGMSFHPSISSDGRLVVFESKATNLVLNDTNAQGDIFVYDMQLRETRRVSVSSSGEEANNYSLCLPFCYSFTPAVSNNGRFITFTSYSTNLVNGDTNDAPDVFVHEQEIFAVHPMSTATFSPTSTNTLTSTVIATSTITETHTPTITLTPTHTYTPTNTRVPVTRTVTNTNSSGPGSLAQAITDSLSGDKVVFAPSLAGETIPFSTPLTISKSLTIDGSGLNPPLILSGEGASGILRITISANVTVSNLTFARARESAIRVLHNAHLTVINSTFHQNQTSGAGGAVSLSGNGNLSITDSSFYQNQAGTDGGAVALVGNGRATILNSSFEQNQAVSDGGAVSIQSPSTQSISNSIFVDNSGLDCGALNAPGMALELVDSTFVNNYASELGGAVCASNLTMMNTSIYFNRSREGGALYLEGNSVGSIANSTITHNTATLDGGALFIHGNMGVEVFNSTFAVNSAPEGSELWAWGLGTVAFYNTALICVEEGSSCIDYQGDILIDTSKSMVVFGTFSAWGLGAPADNGGLTKTMALLPGSPLIDAGDNAICAAEPVNNRDQRGVVRPFGSHCDMGAFEYDGPPTPTPTHTATNTVTATSTPTYTSTPTMTQTITPTATSTITFTPTQTMTPTSTLTSTPSQTPTITGTATPTGTGSPTPTRTPTSAGAAPFPSGNYDDTDVRLQYTGNWNAQNNVNGAYQNTLHVSTAIGNSITFNFVGQELRLFYTAAPDQGRIAITIDGKSFELDQFAEMTIYGSEWLSEFYPAGGTHTVTIEHADGASVNLDQIIIPELIATPTHTATNTATSTSTSTPTSTVTLTRTPTRTPTQSFPKPGVPALVSPANGALVNSAQPVLDWKDSSPVAHHYQVQISTNSGFTAPVLDANDVLVSTFTPTLLPGKLYYWRVRAFNVNGVASGWSSVRNFKTPLTQPELASPFDGDSLLTDRPAFEWNHVDGANQYILQVSTQSNFSTLLVNATINLTEYMMSKDLPQNKTLYWRVRAKSSAVTGPWSPKWTFKTGNPPTIPVLAAPANGSLVKEYTPRLNWSDSKAPSGTTFKHYELQVDDQNDFTSPVIETTRAISEFAPLAELASNTKYYWRVRAVNTIGSVDHVSGWSPVWSFRTVIAAPGSLTMISGAEDPQRPSFEWDDAAGTITNYTIQISTSAGFSTLLVNSTTPFSMYQMTKNLPAGKTIYWRVRVNGANGPSTWNTEQFIIP